MTNLNELKIQKPDYVNILDISDSEYFSSGYSDYISNSKLSLINPDEDGSPEKYKLGLANNKIYSNALEFGSAIHQLVLQPNEFHLIDRIDKPSGKLSLIAEYLYSHELEDSDENILAAATAADYFHGKLSPEKIIEVRAKISDFYHYMMNDDNLVEDLNDGTSEPIYLSSYDKYRCQQCLDSIKKNPHAQRLLYPKGFDIYNEATFTAGLDVLIPEDDLVHQIALKFKGKLDNFIVNDEKIILNDLKTTGHEITKFANSFAKFHYNRQIGLYLYFLRFLYPEIKNVEANIIAVQTTQPFTSHVFPISLESIQNGIKEASKLIKMVAYYEYYGYDKCIKYE